MRTSKLKVILRGGVKKQFNLFLLAVSYFLKLKKNLGKPAFLMVEPTNLCNLHCETCPVGTGEIKKKKGRMQAEDFKKVIDEIGDYIFWINLWNWGEPFLNKNIGQIIKIAHEKKIYVSTSTNGHFLNEYINDILVSGLDELIIALDGLSQETLQKYRQGADFEKVKSGLSRLVQAKEKKNTKGPIVTLQFIVMKHNQHELPLIESFAKEYGVDRVVIKTFGSHIDIDKLNKFKPKEKELSRYSTKKNNKLCKWPWFYLVINYDGQIVPCCYDPFEKHVLGNVFENNTLEVWNNDSMKTMRKNFVQNKKFEICQNCEFNQDISKEINF